jgi:hypothetical protein
MISTLLLIFLIPYYEGTIENMYLMPKFNWKSPVKVSEDVNPLGIIILFIGS